MTTEAVLITDPAAQSSGWYIVEEEAEHAAQQRLQQQWAAYTNQVAIAQLNMAIAMLEAQEWDARSCLIQAGVVEPSLEELEYLYLSLDEEDPLYGGVDGVGRRVIPTPGYIAWCKLRAEVISRVGRRVLGVPGKRTTDPDAWYLHIQTADLAAARASFSVQY